MTQISYSNNTYPTRYSQEPPRYSPQSNGYGDKSYGGYSHKNYDLQPLRYELEHEIPTYKPKYYSNDYHFERTGPTVYRDQFYDRNVYDNTIVPIQDRIYVQDNIYPTVSFQALAPQVHYGMQYFPTQYGDIPKQPYYNFGQASGNVGYNYYNAGGGYGGYGGGAVAGGGYGGGAVAGYNPYGAVAGGGFGAVAGASNPWGAIAGGGFGAVAGGYNPWNNMGMPQGSFWG